MLRQHKKCELDGKAIGRRVREIRGFDLTQSEFGRVVGLTQAQVSRLEKGESLPGVELLLKLKAHSGKSVDWILTGEEA
jgi:transcriptional regulator with XRE-family HTH domain